MSRSLPENFKKEIRQLKSEVRPLKDESVRCQYMWRLR